MTNKLSNSMELSPSWEAASCLATQEFSKILRNPQVSQESSTGPSLEPDESLFCSCQFRRLDPVKFQAHIPTGWHPESRLFTLCQSQSHIATDGQSISKSWCRAPSGAHDQVFLLFDSYGLVFVGRFLWREDKPAFVYAAGLASTVFLGSESLGTRDHILLSQIWDLHFHRLLRLAGSRWKYSTPPPDGFSLCAAEHFLISTLHGPHRKHNLYRSVAQQ
jgi:hypothetical protein